MQEHLDAIDFLRQFGSCTYVTTYRNIDFEISLRVVVSGEPYYNYVFSMFGFGEAIVDMLQQSIHSKQEVCIFTACLSEQLSPLDVPVQQVPVHQLSSLEIEIRMPTSTEPIDASSTHIKTRFSEYKG